MDAAGEPGVITLTGGGTYSFRWKSSEGIGDILPPPTIVGVSGRCCIGLIGGVAGSGILAGITGGICIWC